MINNVLIVAGLWTACYTFIDIFLAGQLRNTARSKYKTLLLAPFLTVVFCVVMPYLLVVALLKWLGDRV